MTILKSRVWFLRIMMQLFLAPDCPSVASSGGGNNVCSLFLISAFILRGFKGGESVSFSPFFQETCCLPPFRAHWLILWNMWNFCLYNPQVFLWPQGRMIPFNLFIWKLNSAETGTEDSALFPSCVITFLLTLVSSHCWLCARWAFSVRPK